MSPEVEKTIHTTSIVAAVLGAVLSPIPLADEVVLVPVFAVMTTRIAQRHGLPRGRVPWKPLFGTAVAGLGARAAVNVTVSYIPGVAAVANAASAALLTQLLGQYVDATCAAPEDARVLTVREILDALKSRLAESRANPPTWWPWRKAARVEPQPAAT